MATLQPQSALLWPLLQIANDGVWHDNNQAFETVFDYLKVSKHNRELVYEKTGDLIMQNRAQFADWRGWLNGAGANIS